MDKKKNFPMNIGLSSILLIFVVLCLVSFSILSIVSANADKKLSLKVLNRSIAYYNACNEAETTLRDVDEQLHTIYSSSADTSSYLASISTLEQTYHYPISDLQELEVTLNYPVPESACPSSSQQGKNQVPKPDISNTRISEHSGLKMALSSILPLPYISRSFPSPCF